MYAEKRAATDFGRCAVVEKMKKRTRIGLGTATLAVVVTGILLSPAILRYSLYRKARLAIESGDESRAIRIIETMHSNRFLDLDWTIQQFIDRVPKGYFLYGKLVGCSHCRGDFYTLLYHSALNGHEELTRIMVNFGASIEYRDDEGVDLLIAAMGSRDLAIVEYVITSGANVNADHFMYPAIHLAIMPPYSPEMINLLLDHGADINSTNESGWTPLDMACIWNTNAIPDLIKLGAKLGEHKKRPLIGQGEDVAQKLRTMHNNALNDTGDSLRGSPSR